MVKVKKFFILLICVIFCGFFTISLTGCSKSEIDKISKSLSNYKIDATILSENCIGASESVDYVNSSEIELNCLCFHLYPRAFRKDALIKPYTTLTAASCFPNGMSFGDIQIEKVAVNNSPAEIVIVGEDEDILQVNFGFNLKPKERVKIDLNFTLTLPNSTHRFGFYEGNINLGNWYPIACEIFQGEFDKSPYYATGDPFFSTVANYEVKLTYPSSYKICSSGEISSEVCGEQTTSTMTAKAIRDFAICLSNDSVILTKDVGGVKLNYMGYENNLDLQNNLEISALALEYFSKIFGKFPHKTLSVVKTPFIYGGMEYPNIVFVSDAVDDEIEMNKVIVHEIAHQWWYSVVGNNEIKEAWLDESLAEYSVALFFENHPQYKTSYDDIVSSALSSYLLYVDVIGTIRGDVNTKMNLSVSEYQNDYEYSYMIYVKGVIMFDQLKSVVGESKLIAGLKKYYDDNKFKIATKTDFLEAFASACHKDLNGFFESYLNGTVIISNLS